MTLKTIAAVALGAAILAPIAAQAMPSPRFERADVNRDGAISEREFYRTQSYERHAFFFRADRDNDRRLTPEEFKSVDVFIDHRRNSSGE